MLGLYLASLAWDFDAPSWRRAEASLAPVLQCGYGLVTTSHRLAS